MNYFGLTRVHVCEIVSMEFVLTEHPGSSITTRHFK